jgi:hypothetical protein
MGCGNNGFGRDIYRTEQMIRYASLPQWLELESLFVPRLSTALERGRGEDPDVWDYECASTDGEVRNDLRWVKVGMRNESFPRIRLKWHAGHQQAHLRW